MTPITIAGLSHNCELRRVVIPFVFSFPTETSCIDIDGKQVKNGDPFVPEGQTSCQHCKCVDGEPDECFIAKCAKPTCDDYKEVAGECCAYTCPSSKSRFCPSSKSLAAVYSGLLQ